jgi:leucyl/phenylalanyl-tRNA--protein transferase
MQLLDDEHKIYLLDQESFDFPTLNMMNDDLVAVGGDFHPQRLINAYQNGLFPWFIDEYNHIHWYCPKQRMVLYPHEFKVSKSLRRTLNNKGFVVKSNENFKAVIENCASIQRKHENDTWIDENFIHAYTNLFELGYAFCIETHFNDKLVGGLYGVLINNVFCGESMFSKEPNASKVAFYHLCNQAQQNGIELIDCQVHNDHLHSLGARQIPRKEYLQFLHSS